MCSRKHCRSRDKGRGCSLGAFLCRVQAAGQHVIAIDLAVASDGCIQHCLLSRVQVYQCRQLCRLVERDAMLVDHFVVTEPLEAAGRLLQIEILVSFALALVSRSWSPVMA